MIFIFLIVFAYIIGSIPTSVWIGRKYYNIDVREHGSKNAGATNTFRVLGKKAGKIVLSIDIIKGYVAVILPTFFGFDYSTQINTQLIASIFVILGHVFPVFVGFKGGKGVATSLGVIFALQPLVAFICLLIFLTVFISSSYVSLGAIITSIAFPVLITFVFKEESLPLIIFSFCISTVVIFAHRKNIKRLVSGCENKMSLFKK